MGTGPRSSAALCGTGRHGQQCSRPVALSLLTRTPAEFSVPSSPTLSPVTGSGHRVTFLLLFETWLSLILVSAQPALSSPQAALKGQARLSRGPGPPRPGPPPARASREVQLLSCVLHLPPRQCSATQEGAGFPDTPPATSRHHGVHTSLPMSPTSSLLSHCHPHPTGAGASDQGRVGIWSIIKGCVPPFASKGPPRRGAATPTPESQVSSAGLPGVPPRRPFKFSGLPGGTPAHPQKSHTPEEEEVLTSGLRGIYQMPMKKSALGHLSHTVAQRL